MYRYCIALEYSSSEKTIRPLRQPWWFFCCQGSRLRFIWYSKEGKMSSFKHHEICEKRDHTVWKQPKKYHFLNVWFFKMWIPREVILILGPKLNHFSRTRNFVWVARLFLYTMNIWKDGKMNVKIAFYKDPFSADLKAFRNEEISFPIFFSKVYSSKRFPRWFLA